MKICDDGFVEWNFELWIVGLVGCMMKGVYCLYEIEVEWMMYEVEGVFWCLVYWDIKFCSDWYFYSEWLVFWFWEWCGSIYLIVCWVWFFENSLIIECIFCILIFFVIFFIIVFIFKLYFIFKVFVFLIVINIFLIFIFIVVDFVFFDIIFLFRGVFIVCIGWVLVIGVVDILCFFDLLDGFGGRGIYVMILESVYLNFCKVNGFGFEDLSEVDIWILLLVLNVVYGFEIVNFIWLFVVLIVFFFGLLYIGYVECKLCLVIWIGFVILIIGVDFFLKIFFLWW